MASSKFYDLKDRTMDEARIQFANKQTVLWQDGSEADSKLEYIEQIARGKGKCFARVLYYCCDLARLPLLEFRKEVDDFVATLGEMPRGDAVIVELFLLQSKILPDGSGLQRNEEDFMGMGMGSLERNMTTIMDRMDMNGIRVKVSWSGPKTLHMEPAGRPWCDCGEVICRHGWSFRMVKASFGGDDKRVGASGFNLDEFMTGGMEESSDSEFLDAFSVVSPEEKKRSVETVGKWQEKMGGGVVDPNEIRAVAFDFVKRMDERNGTNEASKLRTPAAQPPPPPPLPNLPRAKPVRRQTAPALERVPEVSAVPNSDMQKLVSMISQVAHETGQISSRLSNLEVSREAEAVNRPPTPPSSPNARKTQSRNIKSDVGFDDSSSCIERYGERYMDEGTVLTLRRAGTHADAKDNRTVVTVENYLVEGYKMNEDSSKMEKDSVKKLRPINGLARPFSSARLNFLSNVHTAISRSLKRGGGDYLVSLLKSMEGPTLIASDDLLCQVLKTTIDRKSGVFCGNAFNLPYLEIGMPLTEDALIKVFTLLQEEYKLLYFQEMKDISIPKFHDMFKESAEDVLLDRRGKREGTSRKREAVKEPSQRERKPRSMLGF